MKKYLGNRLVKIGLTLLVLGSGPLFGIILFAKLGLTSDPDPNPIFPGMLAGSHLPRYRRVSSAA